MDLTKYRNLFLEEATEHLAEMSRALLELEKTADCADAIDRVFRMAHSIKGMAASLGYDAITEVSHRLEDRMDACRTAGRIDPAGLDLLFRGLEGLEGMVAHVRNHGEGPHLDGGLAAALASGASKQAEEPSKKSRRRS
ncbi:MAG: Hpt domain-containing protein [Myxococcota bacterium]